MRVRDLAQPHPVTVDEGASVLVAAERMRRFHVGNVIVTRGGAARPVPVGILTDRDVAIGIVPKVPAALPELAVADVLARELVVIDGERSSFDAVDLMVMHGIRRLPVVDGRGELVGVVTLDDLVGLFAEQLRRLAEVAAGQRARELQERLP
jgi:CBS domain-containing protein